MGKAQQFEDLLAWQKARALTGQIYGLTRRSGITHDSGLRNQMQRAVVSIMSNIAEGFERGSKREFSRFLLIAKGSCGELRSQLYIALDAEYITQPQFEGLTSQAAEISRMLSGLHKSLRE